MERGGLDRPFTSPLRHLLGQGNVLFLVRYLEYTLYVVYVVLIYYVCGGSISSIYIEVQVYHYTTKSIHISTCIFRKALEHITMNTKTKKSTKSTSKNSVSP